MNSATFVKQFTDSLLSVLNGKDDIIKQLQKRIADLEAQLQQANKQISDLLSHVSSHASVSSSLSYRYAMYMVFSKEKYQLYTES